MAADPRTAPGSERTLVAILLLLTVASGLLDGVAFLGLDQVFVANQTGNIMLLVISLPAGGGSTSVAGSLISVGAFVVGAVAGGRMTPPGGAARPSGLPIGAIRALAIEAVLFAAALAVWAGHEGEAGRLVITALLACGLGIQAATARRVARMGISTVVLTQALTGFAQESPGADGKPGWWRHGLPVLAMAIGGVTGAALAANTASGVAIGGALLIAAGAAAAAARSGRGGGRGGRG